MIVACDFFIEGGKRKVRIYCDLEVSFGPIITSDGSFLDGSEELRARPQLLKAMGLKPVFPSEALDASE